MSEEARRSDLVDLELFLHHESHGAYLFSTDGQRDKAAWLPKSLVEIEPIDGKSKWFTVTVPQWKAEKEGLC